MSSEPSRTVDAVRFGEDFELDFAASKLSRAGRGLKLERIPMEVLVLLVQRRGELVSREEIVERIWGKGVHLDTDNSINGAIRKVRQVLKDDPEQPRFIQTITGKGYRFLAPVVTVEAKPDPVISTFSPSVTEDSVTELAGNRWFIVLGAAILAIAALGVYLRWFSTRAPGSRPVDRPMLAVLPFENLTGDPSQEYFSDGMTEEMITQLGSLDSDRLGVIARTSVMHYKGSHEELSQIARELGVQYVLEGSVRRDANTVRITAQLIQAKDQTHLWARQYDRELKDLLTLQSEIAQEISGEIQSSLGDPKNTPPVLLPSLSPQAYEAYNLFLKGQYFWNKRTVDGLQEAIAYFQQAIEKDPSYARAYAGLADSYALIGGYSGAPPADSIFKARAAALHALELDEKLPEAHAALALIVQNHDYDWETSEKEFKRAIELNPNYATAHHWYAEHLAWMGRFDEALRESERARQLDPLSLIIASDNGAILFYSRQYDRAIARFTAVREMEPDFPRSGMIIYAYIEEQKFAEALAIVGRSTSDNAWRFATLAYANGRAGRHAEAERALKQLLELNRRQPVDPIVMVQAYLGVGDNDQVFAELRKAYAQHSNGLTALKVDPAFDGLRGDPRFQDLQRRVGLSR